MSGRIKSFADGSNPAVHHVAGRNNIGTRIRMGHSSLGEPFQGCVIIDIAIHVASFDETAVAMTRVLAVTNIGDDKQSRNFSLHSTNGALRDAVIRVCSGGNFVFALGYTKENHSADSKSSALDRIRAQDCRSRVGRARASIRFLFARLPRGIRTEEERAARARDVFPGLNGESVQKSVIVAGVVSGMPCEFCSRTQLTPNGPCAYTPVCQSRMFKMCLYGPQSGEAMVCKWERTGRRVPVFCAAQSECSRVIGMGAQCRRWTR